MTKNSASAMSVVGEIRQHAGAAANLLKALANEQRLLVLCTLLDGAKSVGEINARVPLSQSALSQHLAVLRAGTLVTTRRKSQTIYYALAPGPALDILGVLYQAYCAPAAAAPARSRRGSEPRAGKPRLAKPPAR
ncbi:MAG: helix-turn-helix transcriptional regulator [Gammaproteobacteria bacterium]|nr:helix-turn-helix transcriptional regulator [Gammaproteobacteria bacterium]